MNPLSHRVLKAYRPLYQRGLLMDGQYRWPSPEKSVDLSKAVSSSHPRMLLVAMTGLRLIFSFHRNKP